jgi:hypothetical protein
VPQTLVVRLQEVITALDRRTRRPERASEATIARDSAALRAQAVQKLEAIHDATVQTEFDARWARWLADGRAERFAMTRRWRVAAFCGLCLGIGAAAIRWILAP